MVSLIQCSATISLKILQMKFAVLQFINIASSHTSGHHRDKSGFAFFLTLFLPSGIHMYMRSLWAFSSPGWSNPALSASLHMRNVPAQKWTQQPRPGLTSVIFVNYRELSLHLWINYYVSIHQFSKRVGKSRHRITGTYKKWAKEGRKRSSTPSSSSGEETSLLT